MEKDEPKVSRTISMGMHQKVLISIAVTFLLYTVAGFWVLPAVLKNVLEKRIPEVFDILEEITKNHPVLLNRAPTAQDLRL